MGSPVNQKTIDLKANTILLAISTRVTSGATTDEERRVLWSAVFMKVAARAAKEMKKT